jgi:zinc/manganese transport system substrate-binding protein
LLRRALKYKTWALWLIVMVIVACSPSEEPEASDETDHDHGAESSRLTLPDLERDPVTDRAVRLVATTGIIGDVALAIAGDDAEVDVLMAPNQDPHGYKSTARDLQLAADSDMVLVNGWRLEEGLIDDLENAAGDVPIVPVSAGIDPRSFEDGDLGGTDHRTDPHVWLAPSNVIVWVDNIESMLSALDPSNSEAYAQRAEDYRSRLWELDAYARDQSAAIGDRKRVLVTNHDAFGYFADAYGFRVIGTIMPGDSPLAEPASRELTDLIDRMREASICAIFVEHSANENLAKQLATELDHCDEIQIVALYSGALGEMGSGAETYLTMMKANIDLIVTALEPAVKDDRSG